MTLVIAGERPVGSCPATPAHSWATRRFDDGTYRFTVYEGWLEADEVTTRDPALAELIGEAIKAKVSQARAKGAK